MFETLPVIFILTSLVIIITPGQDMILVMSRSISGGVSAGLVTAAGISVGLMGHTMLATLGLGAILSSSAMLFTIIKFAGAGYLVYLGIKMLRSDTPMGFDTLAQVSLRKLFYQGMISNISNPKITIFYFAFLPQFIPPEAGNHSLYLFLLGTSFALLTFFIKAPIGYCAGKISSWLKSHPKVITMINRLSGVILVGLGVRLALASRK